MVMDYFRDPNSPKTSDIDPSLSRSNPEDGRNRIPGKLFERETSLPKKASADTIHGLWLQMRCYHLRNPSNKMRIYRGRNVTLQIVPLTSCEEEM